MRGDGIIVNISSPGGLTYLFNTAYGVGKAAQDRMSQDFNMELKGTGVKVKKSICYFRIINVSFFLGSCNLAWSCKNWAHSRKYYGCWFWVSFLRKFYGFIQNNFIILSGDVKKDFAKKIFEHGQTTDWVGRTVAALVDDPNINTKAGRVIWCHDVSLIQLKLTLLINIIYNINLIKIYLRLLTNSVLSKMTVRLCHLIVASKSDFEFLENLKYFFFWNRMLIKSENINIQYFKSDLKLLWWMPELLN